MTNKILSIIDAQDVEQLDLYLEQNPDIDLNTLTANGASALWFAVTPPKGKCISLPIIELLIATKRVDPTQNQYGETICERNIPFEIKQKISDYEQLYIQQHTITQNDPRTLFFLAANRQNTHESLVVNTYDAYVEKLYNRYVVNAQKKLSWNNDIWIHIHSQSNYMFNVFLANSIKRIQNETGAREITGLNVAITNAELLMLIWHALCDTDPNSFLNGVSMSDSEQIIRKNILLDALIESQNTYGPNRHACIIGTRHKMLESLDKVHCDFDISHVSTLCPEHIAEMYAAHCAEAMSSLETSDPTLWETYISYIWVDIDDKDLLEWIARVRSSFLIKIEEAQMKHLAKFRMQEKTFSEVLKLYHSLGFPLNNQLHPKARLSEQLATIQVFLNHPKENLNKWVENGVTSITYDHLNWHQLMSPAMIDDFDSESIIWYILEGLFQHSPWKNWLEKLPTHIKSTFLKEVIKQYETVAYFQEISEMEAREISASSKRIEQLALEIALKSGYWQEFYIKNTLIFENRDLRGFNFSFINLSKFVFKNCDLRLSGILSNPTLMSFHINSSNEIEEDAIFIAARNHFLTALDILTDRNGWQNELHPMSIDPLWERDIEHIFIDRQYMLNPLFFAARAGHVEAVELLLNKMSNCELANFESGLLSIIKSKSENIAISILKKYASNPAFFEYSYQGATVFIYALNQGLRSLAETIIREYPTVACDMKEKTSDNNGYEESALELSLYLNSPNLTYTILSNIPTDKLINILKNSCNSFHIPLFTKIAQLGNTFLPVISAILKLPACEGILNFRDPKGNTVLMTLANDSAYGYYNYNDIINQILHSRPSEMYIIARQNDRFAFYISGENALTIAAYLKNFSFIDEVLQQYPIKSVLNAINKEKLTILAIAAAQNIPEIIDIVFKCLNKLHETSLEEITNIRSKNGETALTTAASKEYIEIIKKILKYASTKDEHNPEHSEVEALLSYQNIRGETPLMVAVKMDKLTVVKTILEFNASEKMLNCHNTLGETALSMAIKQGSLEIVKTILEKNSSERVINYVNKKCVNIVSMAIESPAVNREIKALILKQRRSPSYLLEFQINRLRIYGEQLIASGQLEEILAGEAAVRLAADLIRCVRAYYSSQDQARQTHKNEIINLLRKGYHAMGEHIRPGCLHLTLVCAASCCLSTPSNEITPLGSPATGYFFQTTRQKEVDKIATLFEQLNPTVILDRSRYYQL